MKKAFVFVLIAFTFSCKKDEIKLNDVPATIVNTGYACGFACDAITYAIAVNDKQYYPSAPLPDNFQKASLNVIVSFKKTGRYPKQFEGPTDIEIIDIVSIRKR